MIPDALKSLPVVFVAVLAQLAVFSQLDVADGSPDLIVLVVAVLGVLTGSVVGALGGFWAGFLLDTASLGILGFSSLLLTLIGYWAGRYGETAGRDRGHTPLVAVAAATVLYALGGFLLAFMLGEPTSARWMLLDTLVPEIALNVLLAIPLYALLRRLFALHHRPGATREVELLG